MAAVWFLLLAATGDAQPYKLVPLQAGEAQKAEASLDKSLLPDNAAHVQLIRGQAFYLQGSGGASVTLLPVTYSISEPGLVKEIPRTKDACGVFVAASGKQMRYESLQEDDTDGLIQCSGLEGVGLARPNGGEHAQVLMLFRMHTVRRTWSEPYAASWSENDGRYVMEHLSPPAGVHVPAQLTISKLRTWVQGR